MDIGRVIAWSFVSTFLVQNVMYAFKHLRISISGLFVSTVFVFYCIRFGIFCQHAEQLNNHSKQTLSDF